MKPAKGRQVQDLILTLGYIYLGFIDIDIDIKGLFCDLVGRICLLSALIGINLWQSHETQALSPQGTPCVSRGLYSPPPKCNHSCRIFTTSLIYGHRHTIALNWSWINGSSVPMNISLDNCLIFYILRFEVFAPTIRAFPFWISRVGGWGRIVPLLVLSQVSRPFKEVSRPGWDAELMETSFRPVLSPPFKPQIKL